MREEELFAVPDLLRKILNQEEKQTLIPVSRSPDSYACVTFAASPLLKQDPGWLAGRRRPAGCWVSEGLLWESLQNCHCSGPRGALRSFRCLGAGWVGAGWRGHAWGGRGLTLRFVVLPDAHTFSLCFLLHVFSAGLQ